MAAVVGLLLLIALMFLSTVVDRSEPAGNYAPDGSIFLGPSASPTAPR